MQVEWLILADSAQIVGGKLYLLGGGWDTLNIGSSFPHRRHLGIAASFRVPWNETNQRHDVSIEVMTEDMEQLAKIDAQLEIGRPAGIPAGTDQRAQLAAEMNIEFKKAGNFVIIAKTAGADEHEARTTFRVVDPQARTMSGGR
jgi:hypothetical protein